MNKCSLLTKWIKIIANKPDLNCDFFFVAENGKQIIIDLSYVKKLPITLQAIVDSRECKYIHIDTNNLATCKYYAFDVDPETKAFKNECDNRMALLMVEDCILDFFEENFAKISKHTEPFTALLENETTSIPPVPLSTRITHSHHNSNDWWRNQNTTYNNYFKERDAFLDPLYLKVKEGKTGKAIDGIKEFFADKTDSDKDLVASILRGMSVDKMDFLTIKQMLISSAHIKTSERTDILNKYKAAIKKAKPQKLELLMKDMQDG